MLSDKVWVVWFELKSNPLDDYGIECVCESEESAQLEVKMRGLKHPKYKFSIWGDFNIIRLIPLGD